MNVSHGSTTTTRLLATLTGSASWRASGPQVRRRVRRAVRRADAHEDAGDHDDARERTAARTRRCRGRRAG